MFTKQNLKQLQNAYRQHKMVISYRSNDNIFYQLYTDNPALGVIFRNKIELKPNAWVWILKQVKTETGLDLASDDIDELSQKNRLDISQTMSNEKLLAPSPTQGFIHVRVLGQTPTESYIGIKADRLNEFYADNLIIIENFVPFILFDDTHLKQINYFPNGKTLIIYRGHDNKNIYPHCEFIKSLNIEKFVFCDYDFAGMNIACDLADKMNAHIILPRIDTSIEKLKPLNKFDVRSAQSLNKKVLENEKLKIHADRLEQEFLAVTQEAVMVSGIELSII